MPIGDVYEVVLAGQQDGVETRNVLHFRSNAADDDPDDLLSDVRECLTDALLGFLSSGWSSEFISAKKVAPTVGSEMEVMDSLPGEVGTAAEPSFVAAVLSYHTAHAGRSGRGRSYIPGVPQASVVDGVLTEGAISALAAFVVCLGTKFLTGGTNYEMGVVSRKERLATPGTIANWFFPVTHIEVDTQVGTQRSRKLGRGI